MQRGSPIDQQDHSAEEQAVNLADEPDGTSSGPESVHNELRSSVVGTVIQIGSVRGDVQVSLSLTRYKTPRQVPTHPATFVNRVETLAALHELLRDVNQATRLPVLAGAPGGGNRTVARGWATEVRE